MAEDGEDKLIAVARHIAKSIGRTDTMTDDILQIFSTFDGRFSREKLSQKTDDDEERGTSSNSSSPERTLRSLDRQISRFVTSPRPIWSDVADSAAFLDAVDALLASREELDPVIPGDKRLLDLTDDLLHKSMLRLEDEFRSLMEQGIGGASPLGPFSASSPPCDSDEETDGEDRIPVAQPVTDYNIVIDALPWGTISDLYEIAKRMAAAGFGKVCAHAYSISRRDFLEESISRLGVHTWSTEVVHAKQWADLEDEIQRWIHAVKVAVRVLFPSERRLCDRVFSDLVPVAELSFAEVCRGPAIQLLGFADAVAVGSKAPERLFRVVDMYEALWDLMPEIDSLFSDQYCSFLRSESGAVCARLGATIRAIFTELENLIRRDPAKGALPGGGVHPITRYVMNYLRAACASWRTLEEVMEEDDESRAVSPAVDQVRPSSSLSVQISWIMEILQGNLDAKSKVYRDPSLSYVFLMNNGRYVIQKVKDTELAQLLGEDWIRRQMARVRQYHNNYQRTTWGKVIEVLQMGGSDSSGGSVKSLREKFRRFNVCFDEICKTQTGWVAADAQLREELRISAVGFVLPAYRNFLGRSRAVLESGKQMERCFKYHAEDVEARISQLFQGAAAVKKL